MKSKTCNSKRRIISIFLEPIRAGARPDDASPPRAPCWGTEGAPVGRVNPYACLGVQNETLLRLDLRWNPVGLLGGRALCSALQVNKTLASVLLTGCDVPADIARAITHAAQANGERRELAEAHRDHADLLNQTIDDLKHEKSKQVPSPFSLPFPFAPSDACPSPSPSFLRCAPT